MKKRILILCTGNSCRSQMAEGFLKSFDDNLEVYSAGTKPAEKINPFAVKAMKEIGIDISAGIAENVDKYLDQSFDYVITVCDKAKETCPIFIDFNPFKSVLSVQSVSHYKKYLGNIKMIEKKPLGSGCANCIKLENLVK